MSDLSKKKPLLLPLGALTLGLGLMNSAVQAQTSALPTVTVEAQSPADLPSQNFLVEKTKVGKVAKDPHQIPQAITSVPRAVLDDQQAYSLKDGLRNVSGLTFNAAEGGRSGDNMMLRGFYTYGDMYLDGVRDTAQYNRELFNIQQIDVMRGAAAMLFGRGQAGGVINQVSKTPFLSDRNEVTAAFGTNHERYMAADLNTKTGEDSAFRLNMMTREMNSWRENPVNGETPRVDRQGFAPSFRFGIGSGNEVTISHYHLKTQDVADYGVGFIATKQPRAPYDLYAGLPGNFDNSETNISTIAHEMRLGNDTTITTKLRHGEYDRTFWACAPTATNGCSSKTRNSDTQNTSLQTDVALNRNWGGLDHELLFGFEFLKEGSSRQSLLNIGTTANPFYTTTVSGTATTYEGKTYSAYVQDTLSLNKQWKLTFGARRDQLKANYSSLNSPSLSFGENSYRAAISYFPQAETQYYLSVSDSFSPTADLYQLSGGEYPAERSRVYELGSKWLWFDGDLAFRTALYHATKDWERNTDLESTASILTKKRHSNGLEFELAGRITEQWEIFAGMSFIKAAIDEVAVNRNATTGIETSANSNFEGQFPRNTPRRTLNLWNTYKVSGEWKLGLGFEAKDERTGYNPSSTGTAGFDPNHIPGYVRTDLLVSYEKQKVQVDLLIKNAFNKTYFDAFYDNGGFAIPGDERRVSLSVKYTF